MRWTERQRAMLREMGVQLWSRETALAEAVAEDAPEIVPVARATPPREARPAVATSAVTTMAARDSVVVEAAMPAADWLVVGEPLDANDPQPAQLLDNLLRAIGVSRSAATRATRAVFVDDPARVDAAIDAAAPRCVIALGRAAAAALLGRDEPIGAWRGRAHRRGEVPVVVTFAPAFLLRHPAEKAKAWLDLCLAVTSASAPSEPSAG